MQQTLGTKKQANKQLQQSKGANWVQKDLQDFEDTCNSDNMQSANVLSL